MEICLWIAYWGKQKFWQIAHRQFLHTRFKNNNTVKNSTILLWLETRLNKEHALLEETQKIPEMTLQMKDTQHSIIMQV